MKLYTEEQVKKAIELARECEYDWGAICFDHTETEIINALTPIELPSDEEIWNEADKEESNSKHYAFTRGAKWMRDKLTNTKEK